MPPLPPFPRFCFVVGGSLWSHGIQPGGLDQINPVEAQDGHGHGQEHDTRKPLRRVDDHGSVHTAASHGFVRGTEDPECVGVDGGLQREGVSDAAVVFLPFFILLRPAVFCPLAFRFFSLFAALVLPSKVV